MSYGAVERQWADGCIMVVCRYVYQTETGEEARLPPVSVEVPVAQSIPYLKRRLEHISFGGHQVLCSPPPSLLAVKYSASCPCTHLTYKDLESW